MSVIDQFRVEPGSAVDLKRWEPDDDDPRDKEATQAEFAELHERFIELTELLYAERKHALLVVLQGMDTSGKDSTTRAVFGGVSPTGIDATSFKAPSETELAHDFLWRVHPHAPARGEIAIFNRSHYEDVLIVRVRQLVPEERWKARYEHINAFEHLLADEGVTIVKLFLHISKAYQKERLQKRVDNPKKHWKFDPNDLVERQRWSDYQAAYEDVLSQCSTRHAPWYVIPAEKRWFRDWLITKVLVQTLERLEMKYPPARFGPQEIHFD